MCSLFISYYFFCFAIHTDTKHFIISRVLYQHIKLWNSTFPWDTSNILYFTILKFRISQLSYNYVLIKWYYFVDIWEYIMYVLLHWACSACGSEKFFALEWHCDSKNIWISLVLIIRFKTNNKKIAKKEFWL